LLLAERTLGENPPNRDRRKRFRRDLKMLYRHKLVARLPAPKRLAIVTHHAVEPGLVRVLLDGLDEAAGHRPADLARRPELRG
jgi:hypothetical protein